MKILEIRHANDSYLVNCDQITYVHFAVDENNPTKVWAKVHFADVGDKAGSTLLSFSGEDAMVFLRKFREIG